MDLLAEAHRLAVERDSAQSRNVDLAIANKHLERDNANLNTLAKSERTGRHAAEAQYAALFGRVTAAENEARHLRDTMQLLSQHADSLAASGWSGLAKVIERATADG